MDWMYTTSKNNNKLKTSKIVLHTPISIHDWLNDIVKNEKQLNIKHIAYHNYIHSAYKVSANEVMEDIISVISNIDYLTNKYILTEKVSASEIEMTYSINGNNSYFTD
jgi:hypothetical protein